MKRYWVIYPFLLACYPVLNLYARNCYQTPPGDIFRPWVLSVVISALLLFLLRLATRSWHRAGLLYLIYFLLFFTFTSVYIGLRDVVVLGFKPGDILNVLGAWLVVFLMSTYVMIRQVKREFPVLTLYLNVTVAVVLIFPLLQIGNFWVRNRFGVSQAITYPKIETRSDAKVTTPDIYYIILDAYARSDILEQSFGVDNSKFLQFLEGRGFYVAEQSHSNYSQTGLSIPSSLTFNYLQQAPELSDPDQDSRFLAHQILNSSPMWPYLRQLGYEIVSTNSYDIVSLDRVDHLIDVPRSYTEFEQVLLLNSVSALWLWMQVPRAHYEFVRGQLAVLPDVTQLQSPKFVFIHLVLPHQPFVFDEQGNFVPPDGIGMDGGFTFYGDREAYVEGYSRQVGYVSQWAEKFVNKLLQDSQGKAIIILQGDHGPNPYYDGWYDHTCIRERMAILNAYYFPDERGYAMLYPSITPVNTFRVVLDAYLGTQLGLLEDRSYYSLWEAPYRFIDVSDNLDACSQ